MTEPLKPAEGDDPFSASSGQLGAPPPPSWQTSAPTEAPAGPPPPVGLSQPPGGSGIAPGPSWGGPDAGSGAQAPNWPGPGQAPGSSVPPPYPGRGRPGRFGFGSGPGPGAYGAAQPTQQPYSAAYPSGGNAQGGQFAYGSGTHYWTSPRQQVVTVNTGGYWALAICGLFTLGLTWLIGIPVSWTAAVRAARRGGPIAYIRRLRGWGIAFIVLSVIALVFWALVVIGISTQGNAGSISTTNPPGPGSQTIPTTHTFPIEPGMQFQRVRWGTAVTLKDIVGASNTNSVPLTVTASDLRYPTRVSMGAGANGDAAVNLRVCATTATVNPGMALTAFTLNGVGNRRYGALSDLPTPFLGNLSPGHCATARVIFRVPSGAKVTGATYAPINISGRGVIWSGG